MTYFRWNVEIWAVQKYVHLVDRVKSFPTNIYLQNLASIRASVSLENMNKLFNPLLTKGASHVREPRAHGRSRNGLRSGQRPHVEHSRVANCSTRCKSDRKMIIRQRNHTKFERALNIPRIFCETCFTATDCRTQVGTQFVQPAAQSSASAPGDPPTTTFSIHQRSSDGLSQTQQKSEDSEKCFFFIRDSWRKAWTCIKFETMSTFNETEYILDYEKRKRYFTTGLLHAIAFGKVRQPQTWKGCSEKWETFSLSIPK